jgi:chemotaxis protein methyltransferase CheR
MLDLAHVQFHGTRSRPSRLPTRATAVSRAREQWPEPVHPGAGVKGLPAFVLARAGLSPTAYRHAPLDRRVSACLRAVHAESELDARALIEAVPDLLGTALSAFLIGVSSFFRDTPAFEALRTVVIPELGARPGPLRVCSIGCSSGAELYSVAILLDEAGLLPRAHLLGLDCRADAVNQARGGHFTEDAVRDLEPAIRARYFDRTRTGWRVVQQLRERTSWQLGDATARLPDGPWDLALCRNVVIYLEPYEAALTVRRLSATLAPGGFLMVGKAERPPESLGLTAVARCVYRSHAD